jgi:hypothetical protein
MVSRVTRWQGRIFAKFFVASLERTEIPGEAFGASAIIESPAELDTPPHWRYERIEDEIIRRILNETEEQLCDRFMSIANEVLQRERKRQGDDE